MYIKSGVSCAQIQPETIFAILICEQVFKDAGQTMTITSLSDGTHKDTSLHYHGLAFDLRIYDLRGISTIEMAVRLSTALGPQYQVINEPSHIHVEYDP